MLIVDFNFYHTIANTELITELSRWHGILEFLTRSGRATIDLKGHPERDTKHYNTRSSKQTPFKSRITRISDISRIHSIAIG